MRQDPDVIMVGEIRDKETAETAIQAALTGHLVFSTLHTNDAPNTIVRLQNMGIEPFLIASALLGALGQRLLRTICPYCKESYLGDRAIMEQVGIRVSEGDSALLWRGTGCQRCGGRGMKGRTGIYEMMNVTDAIRHLILERRSGNELYDQAVKDGMTTLSQAAVEKVRLGQVSMDEVVRVLFSE